MNDRELLSELLEKYTATTASAYCQVEPDDELIERCRAALAARATPAQPVPEISYAISVKETGADLVINRIDGDITTVLHSEFHPMGDTYGLLLEAPEDEMPSPSSVGDAIRALPIPARFGLIDVYHDDGRVTFVGGYTSDQILQLLSEAAALAEQVQGQHVPTVSDALDEAIRLCVETAEFDKKRGAIKHAAIANVCALKIKQYKESIK
jgi:hypothetical protein